MCLLDGLQTVVCFRNELDLWIGSQDFKEELSKRCEVLHDKNRKQCTPLSFFNLADVVIAKNAVCQVRE
jgi:hypothetical protein